jgi:hypothetical protein
MTRTIFLFFVCIGCLSSCQPNYGVEKFKGLLKNGLVLERNPYEPSPSAAQLEFETGQELALSLTIPGQHPVNYPQKEVQFEVKLSYQDLEGSGQFGWGQFDLLFRAERLSLYP